MLVFAGILVIGRICEDARDESEDMKVYGVWSHHYPTNDDGSSGHDYSELHGLYATREAADVALLRLKADDRWHLSDWEVEEDEVIS